MIATTLTGAQAAILNCQVQKPKILRILKTTTPCASTFDKEERMLPLIEHQLYHTLVVTFLNSHGGPKKQGFFLGILQVSYLGLRDAN